MKLFFLITSCFIFLCSGCFYSIKKDKYVNLLEKDGEIVFISARVDSWIFWLIILPPISINYQELKETNLKGKTQIIDDDFSVSVVINPLEQPYTFFSHLEEPETGEARIKLLGTEWIVNSYQETNNRTFYHAEYYYGFGGVLSQDFSKKGKVILSKLDQENGSEEIILKMMKNRKIQTQE